MRILMTVLLSFLLNTLNAQQLNSFVENGVAYVNHKVIKGEGSFAIANVYGIELAQLLKQNNLQKDAELQEGVVLKIPLTGLLKANCTGDSCTPVYYTVQQSEGLYRIGKNHGDLKIAQIKQLNHLNNEAVSKGQQLLVGYLTLAAKTINVEAPAPAADKLTAEPVAASTDKQVTPVPASENNAVPATAKHITPKKLIGDTALLTYHGTGAFASLYKTGNNQLIMQAASFKSESGWTDGKFYALMDGVETGTVLSIKNPANGVAIYARIVGPLPQVKHAEAVTLRISSAAMLSLGFVFDSFYEVQVSY